MPNGRIHRTCICEKSAEAQIRVYIGKQNCAHFDIAIAQEAYTGDWYPRPLGPLICTWIENELSEFSVIGYGPMHSIGYGANEIGDWSIQIVEMQFLKGPALAGIFDLPNPPCIPTVSEHQLNSETWSSFLVLGDIQQWNETTLERHSKLFRKVVDMRNGCMLEVEMRPWRCSKVTLSMSLTEPALRHIAEHNSAVSSTTVDINHVISTDVYEHTLQSMTLQLWRSCEVTLMFEGGGGCNMNCFHRHESLQDAN